MSANGIALYSLFDNRINVLPSLMSVSIATPPQNHSNMDRHRLNRVAAVVNAALVLLLLLAVTSSVAGSGRYYDDDDVFPVVVERRGGSPACRRCALNRHDWSSCTACYRYARRGSGRIPYYGKRASTLDDDVMATPDDVIE